MKNRDKRKIVKVYSIFYSLQGESTFTGLPTVFIRLAGCNAGCSYCDTVDACVSSGKEMSFEEIFEKIEAFGVNLVEVTGGEPLEQDSTKAFLNELVDKNYDVLLETNGLHKIKEINDKVNIILDIKTPGSGVADSIIDENLNLTDRHIEYKFVVTSMKDFEFADNISQKYKLFKKGAVLVSPLKTVDLKELAVKILETKEPFRLQLQQHKIIWGDVDFEC
ncbi:MAG: radical SAM protein [Deltaproteobacteria bacterium]|nr:radical SAM protein [Deltaproteobacteria bacterium]